MLVGVEPIVKPLPDEWFVDHGHNAEMRWEAMGDAGYLVPAERFFVRNHTRTPAIDPSTWRLHVRGPGVERELEPEALEVALERGRRTDIGAAVDLATAAARSRSG